MTHFSIKWKLSISFVALSMMAIGLYVLMATKIFESDKISYIFDSEQSQVENISKQIEQKFETTFFSARAILAGFDSAEKKLSPIAKKLFDDQKDLRTIELYDATKKESLIKVEKEGSVSFEVVQQTTDLKNLNIKLIKENYYLISSKEKNSEGDELIIYVVAYLKDLVPISATGDYLLSQNLKILNEDVNKSDLFKKISAEIIQDISQDRSEKTTLKEIEKQKFLVSSVSLKFSNLKLTSVVDQETALSALSILLKRSIVFIIFSAFGTVIISVILSSGLTKSLQTLTLFATKIGQGDFSNIVSINSKDEIGILSNAFVKMSDEIQRLLIETKDKARMEAELKTARLVQDSLFPMELDYAKNDIGLSGLFVTSTECGGDWWHYFEKGDDTYIVIADATGHGTPAALITSAARAVFVQMEISNLSLQDMIYQWNQVVSFCSKQKMYMTALILQIHRPTGRIKCVNASHELPYVFKKNEGAYEGESVPIPSGPRLGSSQDLNWEEFEFQLAPGDKLVLFTDGLTEIENPDGKVLGEKRILKNLQKACDESVSSSELSKNIYASFEKHRKGHPLNDDVTLVVVERKEQVFN